MPLFHFHLADHACGADLEGTDLIDAEEARLQAIVFSGEYLRDNPDVLADGNVFRVNVTDDRASALFTVQIEMIDRQSSYGYTVPSQIRQEL